MELVINILGAAALGHLGADFNSQFSWMPDKPTKCNMCLSFWLSCGPFIFLYSWQGILYAALAGVVSELYLRQLQ